MDLIYRLLKRWKQDADRRSADRSLPWACYQIAYFIIPHYLFEEPDKLESLFTTTPETWGSYFYTRCCIMNGIEPNDGDMPRFRTYQGELDHSRDYFVLEYPTHSESDHEELVQQGNWVYAIHYSAIIRDRATGSASYFVLGDSPLSGATALRSVTPTANCNLGRGPEPTLDALLGCLGSSDWGKIAEQMSKPLNRDE